MSQSDRSLVYEAGQWQVHFGRRELLADGVPVPIGDRAFEIVEVLVQSANELVTKDDLMDRIWPGAIVGENTIQVHISAIRKALGQDRGMLKTTSGRGYRLLGNWTVRHHDVATPPVGLQQIRTTEAIAATNLPAAVTRLIGRSAAAQRLRDLVSAWRAVTLTGPGGIGKTTLALEVARGLLGGFDGGGWLVELASLSDPDLVPSAVASVLGLKISGGTMSAESVARAVGRQHLLLVLDNCEHVIDAAANLTEVLVRRCPRTTIMATSREVLRFDGEYVYRVPPLEAPAEEVVDPDHILGHSAVELFITRTQALESDFVPRAEDLPRTAAICRRLDGIPLAIEFAAARAAMLGIHQVAIDLGDRLALLTDGRRTALPRQRTLRAVLDWSHELLTPAERLLLRRLAIYPAGFTLEAADAVMNDSALDLAAVTDGITNLMAKSLVMRDQSAASARWYLLETTRAYALEKLVDSGEAGPVARRQVEFYLALFAPFGTEGQLQAALDDFGRYRVEVDNLRAALNWAFSAGGDAALGMALAATAADFWVAAWLMSEGCEWAGKALARIGGAAGTRHEMLLECSFGISLLLTRAMTNDAREALTRALMLAGKFADFDYQQRATSYLWLFSLRAAALDSALTLARQFEEVAGFGDVQSRAVVDSWLGMTLIYRGAHVEAIECARRAIDLYPTESRKRDMIRFAGDLPAITACQIGVSLLSRGLLDTVARSAVRAIEEAHAINHPAVICVGLAWAAGFVFLSLSELELAERYGEELIEYASRYGLHPFFLVGLCVRGSLAVRRGDPAAGIDLLRRGLTEMGEASYQTFRPFFLVELAAALGALGRIDDGLTEIDAALRFATETGHRWFVPETFRVKGQLIALRDPNDPEIEDCVNRGAEVAREQDALFWELRLALCLARLRMNQGRHSEARQILAPVYDRFTEGFATSDLRAAKALLDALTP